MEIGNNIKATLSHIDPSIKEKLPESCHLSIQVHLKGFTYALLNLKEQKYIALEHYDFVPEGNFTKTAEAIDQVIASKVFLQNRFTSVSASISHQTNALIPRILFDKNNEKELLAFDQAILQNEKEYSDWLPTIQAFNSYTIPDELKRCLEKHFKRLSWKHDSSILIESLINQFKLQQEQKIYLSIQDNYFEMAVLKREKLIFFNSFSYQTAEDFIYYLLFACEQLNLNPEQIPVVISGKILNDSEIYQLVYRYIRHVEFSSRNASYKYSFVFDDVKEHFHYKLLNQHLCVS